jgi:hypothetical protein
MGLYGEVPLRALETRSPRCPWMPPPMLEGTELALAFSSVKMFCSDS